MDKIEKIIKNTNEENQNKINWTKEWSIKYPILKKYQKEIDIEEYSNIIKELLNRLEKENHYNKLDSMLVLKDILYKVYKEGE